MYFQNQLFSSYNPELKIVVNSLEIYERFSWEKHVYAV